MHVIFWENEYILRKISRFSVKKVYNKLLLNFLITNFLYRQALLTCFIIHGEFDADAIKNSCDLNYYFGVFLKDLM